MARKFPRGKKFNPIAKLFGQYSKINNTYGNIESSVFNKDRFVVTMNIIPSENSQTYKVEISYRYGYKPKAVLLSPKLQQRNGQYPHHTYGKDERGYTKLCVYCPYLNEWDDSMSIATSFIPWVSTWLNAYEYWLITGEWHYDEIVDHGEITEESAEKQHQKSNNKSK